MFNANRNATIHANLENYMYAFDAYVGSQSQPVRDLNAQTQAFNLAGYFRAQRNLALMAKYLALATQQCAERTRVSEYDNPETSFDLVIKDKNFDQFFRPFGYNAYLGPIIADKKPIKIYIPPRSIKNDEVEALVYVLRTKPTVEMLDLSHQYIQDSGARELLALLCDHPGIKKVYLDGNQINDETQTSLIQACPHVTFSMKKQRTAFEPRHN